MIEIKEICLFEAFETGLVKSIAHQCNCQKNFGSGIALAMKNKYPEVYQADLNFDLNSRERFGGYSYANTYFGRVYNIYGQYTWGKGRQTSYEAFFTGLEGIKGEMISNGENSLGIPYKIGSDRGGADWSIIYAMIVSVFTDSGIDVVICKK